jgi:hypothetical protein
MGQMVQVPGKGGVKLLGALRSRGTAWGRQLVLTILRLWAQCCLRPLKAQCRGASLLGGPDARLIPKVPFGDGDVGEGLDRVVGLSGGQAV